MKSFIKSVGIIAAIATAAHVLIKAASKPQKAKIRAYRIGSRWFAEIEGVKSQDLSSVIQTVALYCPTNNTETEDGGEGAG